ncbi:RNA-binding domain-containing protein, partial [Dacryopinax primogenitus]
MSLPPNTCLYINNLNDKINKEELRAQLYALFTPYGKVIDVVARKGTKMKGQAFVVFGDLAGATTAMRAMDGEFFYDKPMHIQYGRTKSHATIRIEQGADAVPFGARSSTTVNGKSEKIVMSRAEGEAADRERAKKEELEGGKRPRESGVEDGAPQAKKNRTEDEDDAVEMEIEDDE